jgi:hypothetical protein
MEFDRLGPPLEPNAARHPAPDAIVDFAPDNVLFNSPSHGPI